MTFLNLALAFGAAACVIPIVIHLLNRRRFETVKWGATHLLAPVLRTNRKRIKLEQLILLLTRMAILALLALCMAGPVLTGWHALSGNAKSSLLLLFDNSYSMDAGHEAATNLDLAKKNAGQLIEHGRRGSDVSVVLMAGGKVTGSKSPSTNRKRAAQDLAELPSGFGTAEVAQSFDAAARAVPKMQHAKRDLVIVSDFQATDWAGDSATSLAKATELISAMPIKPTVTLMKVGNQASDNVSITSLDISPRIVATNQEVRLRVNIRNHGDVPYPGIRVNLQVDGKDISSDSIDLASSEDGQLLFRHAFNEPGSHIIRVSADADALLADNQYSAVVPVWDRLPVLLVDGDTQSEPLKSETAFLQLALSPFLAAADQVNDGRDESLPRADLLHATTISPAAFSADALATRRVLILANVPRLTSQQLAAVKEFVAGGNSLLVFPGDRIDVDWYRRELTGELMSVAFSELQSSDIGQAAAARSLVRPVSLRSGQRSIDAAGVRISSEHFDHPAFDLFNDQRHGNLADGSIKTWYRLAAGESKPTDEFAANNASTIARLSTGDPLLVENSYGDGRVITFATTCDDAWTNLPARPFYLPLMQRLVTYLATAVEPTRNLATGQTIVAHLPAGTETATVTRPDGEHVQITKADRGQREMIEYADTAQPGLYTIQAASLPELHYVVTAAREESELKLLDSDEMETLAGTLVANLAHSTDEYIAQDSQRRYGREVWRQMYWLMLICVVGEVLLQQAFSGFGFRQK